MKEEGNGPDLRKDVEEIRGIHEAGLYQNPQGTKAAFEGPGESSFLAFPPAVPENQPVEMRGNPVVVIQVN